MHLSRSCGSWQAAFLTQEIELQQWTNDKACLINDVKCGPKFESGGSEFAFIQYNICIMFKVCWCGSASLMSVTSLLLFLMGDSQSVTAAFVSLPVSSSSSCQGAEWKPGREGGSSWRTTASTTSNTQQWVSREDDVLIGEVCVHVC